MKNGVLYNFIIVFGVLLFGHVWAYSQSMISIDDSQEEDCFSYEILNSTSNEYEIKVNIHRLIQEDEIINGVSYKKLSLGDNVSLQSIGQPALPVIHQELLIPGDSSYHATISNIEWTTVNTNGFIYPYQRPLLEEEVVDSLSFDSSIYYESSLFNPQKVFWGEEKCWKGARNVPLLICPFMYNPQANLLWVMREFVVNVTFTTNETGMNLDSEMVVLLSEKDKQIFSNASIIENLSLGDNGTDSIDEQYDYLIIIGQQYSDIFDSPELQKFRKWKAFKGLKTKVVSTEVTGTTNECIKNYINNEYLQRGIKYVLLVGDVNSIPIKTNDIGKGDYWYGCLDGEFDQQAEVPVGRFPISNIQEFINIVEKTISYENTYKDYMDQVLLIANKENAPNKYQQCLEQVRTSDYIIPIEFITAYGALPQYGGNSATNSLINNYTNSGVNIINYRGHGNNQSWKQWNSEMENYSMTEISHLSDSINPIYFSIACSTGNIQQPCFLKTFICSSNGGAAFLGATLPTYTLPNHSFNRYLFSNLLSNGYYRIGDLNVISHINNLSENNTAAYVNALSYICGGDPSLEIWTGNPQSFQQIRIDEVGDSLRIITEEEDYYISIVSELGELVDVVESSGHNVFFDKPENNGYIVINKHDYIPYVIQYDTQTSYIQNTTFSNGTYYYDNSPLSVGYDVTNTISFGNVIVNPKVKLQINNHTQTIIKNGFEVKKGAELIIK
jgi:hypothetical protein